MPLRILEKYRGVETKPFKAQSLKTLIAKVLAPQ
jgi:hypothetical protein